MDNSKRTQSCKGAHTEPRYEHLSLSTLPAATIIVSIAECTRPIFLAVPSSKAGCKQTSTDPKRAV